MSDSKMTGMLTCPDCKVIHPLGGCAEYLREKRLASAMTDALRDRLGALTGYELAGCADRADVLLRVVKGITIDFPVAADWDRFAKEVCKWLAAQPAPAVMGEDAPLDAIEALMELQGHTYYCEQLAADKCECGWNRAAEVVKRWTAAARTAAAESREEPSPELLQLLKDSCDRDWKDESPEVIIRIACNALYWRDYEIAKLREESDNYQRGYDDARRIYERKLATLRQPGESPT